MDVGESGLASVSGLGLSYGRVDTPTMFTIDGRGLLGEPQVTVDGPDSVAKVNMRQQEEGLYQVTTSFFIIMMHLYVFKYQAIYSFVSICRSHIFLAK